ncbi:LacI family transcriptional regulator [Bacillus ginsengihumi]|uniref:LacI family transcriptional regulator n=1 Tax=Heyndrickxia ginsengihumi TaxID=363870 RepID=A0A0A6XWV3_9BACI|nr:LacI family DNA-binding transcriptional regulator [Heyndrickxia ginsengihumi]KHD84622.1 LacI family transcriptional regulator [Heyndrickxia ginsengihumi]MCM3025095.1 LacI family transcriptional regulator [Heyndrickxia ginsengihumi]NEY19117.1 LacI family transcriptional regulator [Heyndrickxia ginsengihumi]
MANIEDVAKLAGLSRATVSRVINNQKYVTEETRQRVYKAMDQLGYYPNSSAQRLRNQRTNTIAVLVPFVTNPFFAYLLEGIDAVAMKYGIQLLVCQTRNSKEKELQFFRFLQAKQVDGIILTSIENRWDDLKTLTNFGPVVLCNDYVKEANLATIKLDQQYGSYIGTKHLLERGHTKIAYCEGKGGSDLAKDRLEGFKLALKEHQLLLRKEWMFQHATNIEGGKMVLRKILAMEDRPTAIFSGSDQVAAGIMMEAQKAGIQIPNELAVVGFDNQPIAELTSLGITTICQPIEKLGEKAMYRLLQMLFPEEQYPETPELTMKLIIRGST